MRRDSATNFVLYSGRKFASIASASRPTGHQLPGGTSSSSNIDSSAWTARASPRQLPP